ncbi:uncharacterized protein LOC118793271 [Megalops cyprinoides]|uniref:uncharacterized protein LOC118793271 n=1 Tax=Megalops cyprinoides TaxID=118141 RepID=UPI001864F05F|nr:uncharacterized protein LOC118793271 [Megalops cyprinoides]
MSRRKDIVSKDFGPGPRDAAEIYGPHIMHAYETMMDLIRVQSIGFDALQHGFFGLDFTEEYYVSNDDDDNTDVDSDYEDGNSRKAYCGYSRNFLERAATKARSLHPPCPPRCPLFPYRPGFTIIDPEEAERNARELVDEEERLKEKAEKKRLKKMKQKERKRQERLQKEKENAIKKEDIKDNPHVEESSMKLSENVNHKSNKQVVSSPEDSGPSLQKRPGPTAPLEKESSKDLSEEEESEEESIASEPEELDLTSSFVSKAAIIAKRKLELKAKKEKKKTVPNQPKEKPKEVQENQQQDSAAPKLQDVVLRSMELAVTGNKLASAGRFELAVKYFTDAIKYNPKEFRLFGNRSYCYEKMCEYGRALTDAEIALTMSPHWIKGLYRKGRALAGLKRYREAAVAFKEVLKLDSTSMDAAQELMTVQIMELMGLGLSREQSSNALIIYGTVEKVLEALSNIPDLNLFNSSLPTASASQPAVEDCVATAKQAPPKPSTPVKSGPAKNSPQPPLFPVWVGNLVPSISEKLIHRIFSVVGEVYSMKLLRARGCAFVNYTKAECCERAIRDIHGLEVEGTKLLVRYPDRIHAHLGMVKAGQPASEQPKTADKSTGECFFWRNAGCIKKERCIYRHVPEHKGIDRVKGQTAPP